MALNTENNVFTDKKKLRKNKRNSKFNERLNEEKGNNNRGACFITMYSTLTTPVN